MALQISQHDYHRTGMAEAGHQFDEVETTISHLFRFPHPALKGRTFGESLVDRLVEERPKPRRVVEVGGGTGSFAESLHRRLERRRSVPRAYVIVDLSPSLQAAQRQRLKAPCFRFVTGSATRLPLRDGSVDGWLVSNEVIADLDVVEFSLEPGPADDAADIAMRGLVERYDLVVDRGAARAWLNSGAIAFVEEAARVLAPGAIAYLSEFGADTVKPVELTDLKGGHGHTEYSIRFDHLVAVASALGLEARVVPMVDYLAFDRSVRVCNLHDALLARFYHPSLEVYAYTREQLGERIGHHRVDGLSLRFPEVGGDGFPDNHTRPMAQSFQCLILRKPGAPRRPKARKPSRRTAVARRPRAGKNKKTSRRSHKD